MWTRSFSLCAVHRRDRHRSQRATKRAEAPVLVSCFIPRPVLPELASNRTGGVLARPSALEARLGVIDHEHRSRGRHDVEDLHFLSPFVFERQGAGADDLRFLAAAGTKGVSYTPHWLLHSDFQGI